MKSPATGKEMKTAVRKDKLTYRKEEFEINYHSYKCEDSGEEYTDDDLDLINTNQVYNQYRVKHGIPFPDEIKEIRKKYGLSASKMSDILGLGANSYRLYEAGEMPSVSNGRLISLIKHPKGFKNQLIASSAIIEAVELANLIAHANKIYEEEKRKNKEDILCSLMENIEKPNEFNGFKTPNFERISQIISRYSSEMELYKTKLNKLLFYTDFLFYRNTGFSMTGLTYKAIPYGPVPSDYELLYTKLEREEKVIKIEQAFENGNVGEIIQGTNPNDEFVFSEKENEILTKVIGKFRNNTSTQMIQITHNEKAWIENEKERKKISYQKYAFDLVGI